jgi:hypothetical protein
VEDVPQSELEAAVCYMLSQAAPGR